MQSQCRFVNEPLPYAYKAMEPYIDIQTMYLHHDKHLQTYIDRLNELIDKCTALQSAVYEEGNENWICGAGTDFKKSGFAAGPCAYSGKG